MNETLIGISLMKHRGPSLKLGLRSPFLMLSVTVGKRPWAFKIVELNGQNLPYWVSGRLSFFSKLDFRVAIRKPKRAVNV
jgi:hypothetical protein